MGQGADVNTGPPTLRATGLYELSWGRQAVPGDRGWHVATSPTAPMQLVTWAEWQAIAAAASVSTVAMLAALAASPAAAAWADAEAMAAAHGPGVITLRGQTRARYAAWDGVQPSPWTD
jgi:hypothetical protein